MRNEGAAELDHDLHNVFFRLPILSACIQEICGSLSHFIHPDTAGASL